MRDSYSLFTKLIASINRKIHRLEVEVMARFDLKRSHLSCIYYIHREESVTPAELCKLCGEDKANISRALKQLEDEGYVTRAPRKTPRSRVYMTLTEKGAEIGGMLRDEVDRVVELASGAIEKEDIRAMYRVLEAIDGQLSFACDDNS